MKPEHLDSITTQVVRRAFSTPKTLTSGVYDICDDSCDGLMIRVTTRSASWYVRGRLGGKQKFWRIKGLLPDDDPKEMRARAIEARQLAARGIDPKEWLQEKALGGKVERTFDPEKDGWDWETARDTYLEFIKKHRRPATYDDYRKTLNGKDLKVWEGKLVKSLTKDDVKKLQDSIYARGAERMALHTLTIVKTCLKWVAERSGSGIDASPAERVAPLALGAREDDEGEDWVPTPEQIGTLPWLMDRARIHPAARLAAMLTLLTVQRRHTVASARKADFTPISSGGALWAIPSAYMKSGRKRSRGPDGRGRPHVVPLPAFTWGLVRHAMALGGASDIWLFPQLRLRRAGDAGGGHMSAKEIADAMKTAGSPVRPHACRRAFGTYGEQKLGFNPWETPTILDHAEGRSGNITSEVYSLHDGTHFKWGIMKKWEEWVLEHVAEQRPAGVANLCPAFFRN